MTPRTLSFAEAEVSFGYLYEIRHGRTRGGAFKALEAYLMEHEIPFDRYFPGRQPEIGLPQNFDWNDGYHARYLVTPEDVVLRVPPALAGARQAWAVLSHDSGRGSDYLIGALDRWGIRVSEQRLVGIRVLRYQIRG